mmetsp:Transcript_12477/g.25336  ORF Transcript_12477/g.25336 Transcript_12477/m.25336 type:complete len:200 (-) Transcript_12477:1535-2134(-)
MLVDAAGAGGDRFLRLYEDVLAIPGHLQDNDVDDSNDLAAVLLLLPLERSFALAQLVRELLQGLVPVLSELGDVDAAVLEKLREVLLADADGRAHERGGVAGLPVRVQLDLFVLAILLGEPLVGPGVAHGVRVDPLSAVAGHADSLEHRGVGGCDLALEDLLAVDRAHARVGGGQLVLLEALGCGEVDLDVATLEAEAV